MNTARKLIVVALSVVCGNAFAQVPDMVNAFEAGGRAMGAGGALAQTSVNTLSAANNPAGLGFVTERQAGFAARNFPTTRTIVTGDLDDLRLDTQEEEGDIRASHVGIASPMSGNRGAWGISWTTGGWMNDNQIGGNLGGGVAQFLDAVRIKTDFVNLSWGRANSSNTFSFGAGLVVASQTNFNRRRIQFSDPNIPTQDSRAEDSDTGFGAIVGAMWIPKGQANATFGVSLRTPIELSDGGAMNLYNKIPGRASFGAAFRQDGYRNGSDYLIWGAEANYYFSGEGSERVMRDDFATGHFGVEYNYNRGGFTVPVRIGYAIVPAGGDDFNERNSFTYGIGYRPTGKNWSIELNYGQVSGGERDTGISFAYRF